MENNDGRRELKVSHEAGDDKMTIVIEGHFNYDNSVEHHDNLINLVTDGPQLIILDLSKLNFIASAGIRILVHLRKICDKKGKTLQVTELPPEIKKVLDACGLMDFFNEV